MRTKLVFLLMLGLVFTLPIGGIDAAVKNLTTVHPAQSVKLTIVTRHDVVIYDEFAAGFAASSYGKSVGITSPTDIKFLSISTYDGFKKAMENPQLRVSLGWGGGPTLFNNLYLDGAISPIKNTTVLQTIKNVVPDNIAGANMKYYDTKTNDLVWVANAISSFGFTVNNKVLKERNLTKPQTWIDLASPDFYTDIAHPNVGLGNAPLTTSNTRIYHIILQKYGWVKGWQILSQMAGNGKIYDGSVETRSSVINGETAAAMTIDFYGLIAQQENPDTEYIIPKNASIVNGDPIALAKTPDNPAAANAFIEFLLSKEGQSLWLKPTINRLPVRSDAFDTPIGKSASGQKIHKVYNDTLANQGIQFNESLALSLEEPMRYFFQSSISDEHVTLQSVWDVLATNYKTKKISTSLFNNLTAQFGTPTLSEAEAIKVNHQFITDATFKEKMKTQWRDDSKAKYLNLETQLSSLGFINSNVKSIPVSPIPFLYSLILLVPVIKRRRQLKL